MKKIIALLITFVMVFSLGGCVKQETRDKNKIYIDFEIVNNGYGYQWLIDACEEFEELVKNVDYDGEGPKKPGVVCKVRPVDSATDASSVKQSGTEVFMSSGAARSLLQQTDNVLDITDVVQEKNYHNGTTSIEDLMYPEALDLYRVEGKYYTIPTYEIYGGITYDKQLFDDYGFYFAKDSSVAEDEYDDPVTGEYAFFTSVAEDKSVGPDGISGTYDDGMPSSLIELIQLYSYMDDNQVYPLQVPGKYLYESDFATDGLFTALLGEEKASTMYSFNGKVDVVKEIKTTDVAFENLNGDGILSDFYKPVVENITVTEETGYYTTWSLERYYTLIFLDICKREGWLAPGANPDVEPFTHQQAQFQFISSGYDNGSGKQGTRVGTMSTGSYWYNESLNSFTNFLDFEAINPSAPNRDLLWMPLPVNIFTSVTGEEGVEETPIEGYTESTKGEKQAIIQEHTNGMFFNKNVLAEPETYEALKDWIRFFHCDEQLEKATIRRGFKSSLQYEIRDFDEIPASEQPAMKKIMQDSRWMDWKQLDENGKPWESFYKQLADYVDDSYLLRFAASNETFLLNSGGTGPAFKRGEYSKVSTDTSGQGYLKSLYKTAGYNAMKCFEKTMLTYNNWLQLYKGNGEVGKVNDIGWGGFNPAIPA